jgi:HAD superfamily hydrolase (TIGR01490 family)
MNSGTSFSYLAFYDLDHTILVDNSATHLINEARARGIMSEKHFRHAVWLSILYKLGIGDSAKMIIRMLSWLKGLREEVIEQLCKEVLHDSIIGKVRPEILQTFRDHRENKGGVVMLSSASEPICHPAARHLKMDDVICSRLETRDGVFTGRTVGRLVYGEEKKNRLLAYCKQHGYDPRDAYYYGDSYMDQSVMAAVGHPVAVDPDKRLSRIALRNNWPILIRDRA